MESWSRATNVVPSWVKHGSVYMERNRDLNWTVRNWLFFKGGGVVKSVSIKGRGLRAIGRPGARSSNCVFVDEREKATRLAAPARSAGCS